MLTIGGYSLRITPMQDGIMVNRDLLVHTKLLEWTITFTLDNPSSEMKDLLVTEIQSLRSFLNQLPKSTKRRLNFSQWMQELSRVEYRAETLMHQRMKRSLLPIIGDIAHDLFGTATVREIEHIMQLVNDNRNALNKVTNFQNEQLTLINITKEEMKQNRKAINDIISLTSSLTEQIANITANSHAHYYATYQYNLIQDRISALWQHLDELQAVILRAIDQRDLLEQGRLGEQLISVETLKEVANLHDISGIALVQPIEWYYTYCRVFPIWNNEVLAFTVRLPLIDSSPQEGYQIKTFPVPIKDSNTTVKVDVKDFVTVDAGGKLHLPKHCIGENPIVCDPAPTHKNKDTQQECAQSVILKESKLVDHCPMIFQVYPDSLMFHAVPNHVILVTRGEVVREQCSGQDQQTTLPVGVFQIEWGGGCFFSAEHWFVKGVRTRQIEHTLNYRFKPWNIEHLDLPQVIQTIKSTKDLKLPSRLSDLKTVRLNYLPTLPPISTGTYDHFRYIWLCILIIVVPIIILILKVKAKFCFKIRNVPVPEVAEEGKQAPFRLKLQTQKLSGNDHDLEPRPGSPGNNV